MDCLRYWLYDCFSEYPLQGHPAALVELEDTITDDLKFKVARELAQSITCFVQKTPQGIEIDSIARDESRWPINHGLLAVARHVQEACSSGEIIVDGASHQTKVSGDTVSIILPRLGYETIEIPDRLNQVFDSTPVSVSAIGKTCIVEFRTVEEIINISLDMSRMAKLEYDRVLITAEDDTVPFDFVCRYFSPKHKIVENQASLYAQTFLSSFWFDRLDSTDMTFLQLSSRKGVGRIIVDESNVEIEGQIKKTFEGRLKIL